MYAFMSFVLLMWSLILVGIGMVPFLESFGEIQTTTLMLQLITMRMLAMAVIWMALFALWMLAERYKK